MDPKLHPDLPRCTECGKTSGPWVPNGERDSRGAQLFECSPGHGCRT